MYGVYFVCRVRWLLSDDDAGSLGGVVGGWVATVGWVKSKTRFGILGDRSEDVCRLSTFEPCDRTMMNR
jgi:hypothetical protein